MENTFKHEIGAMVLITGWGVDLPTPGRVVGRRMNENLNTDGTTDESVQYQVEVPYLDGIQRVKLGDDALAPNPKGKWPLTLEEITAHWAAIEGRKPAVTTQDDSGGTGNGPPPR